MLLASDATVAEAAAHLSLNDPVLRPVIESAGFATLRPHGNYYQALVESIVGQQLSVKAAHAIRTRFIGLFKGEFPTPEQLLKTSVEELRNTGFSGAKARYVRDLAQHIVDGKVIFDHLDGLTNEEIIAELTPVKGIGLWTVHMFLMFCMGRLDVLATGDLGIRNGVQKLYGLEKIPSPLDIEAIANKYLWHPYESAACWYVWQSLDNSPVNSAAAS